MLLVLLLKSKLAFWKVNTNKNREQRKGNNSDHEKHVFPISWGGMLFTPSLLEEYFYTRLS